MQVVLRGVFSVLGLESQYQFKYRATALADRLNVNFGLIHRSRVRNGDDKEEDHMDVVVGNVQGKVALLVDDMVVSAQTMKLASTELAKKGATAVYAIVSHGEKNVMRS